MFLNGVPIMRIIKPTMSEADRAKSDMLIKIVDDSCNEYHTSPDWAAIMRLVDEINNTNSKIVISETVRAIRKKLANKSLTVVLLALTLTEALVKNCDYLLHREIASEGFMQDMTVLAQTYCKRTRRESLQVADKTLELIQSWGEAFLPQRRTLPLFVDTYHMLRKEGLPFDKQYKDDRPPVLEPAGPGSLLDNQKSVQESSRIAELKSSNRVSSELSKDEFEIVTSVETAAEMLASIAKAKHSLDDTSNDELMMDLVTQLEMLESKLVPLISSKSNASPKLLDRLFTSKDSMDTALQIYRDVITGKFHKDESTKKGEVNLLGDVFDYEMQAESSSDHLLNTSQRKGAVKLSTIKTDSVPVDDLLSISFPTEQVNSRQTDAGTKDIFDPFGFNSVSYPTSAKNENSNNSFEEQNPSISNLGSLYGYNQLESKNTDINLWQNQWNAAPQHIHRSQSQYVGSISSQNLNAVSNDQFSQPMQKMHSERFIGVSTYQQNMLGENSVAYQHPTPHSQQIIHPAAFANFSDPSILPPSSQPSAHPDSVISRASDPFQGLSIRNTAQDGGTRISQNLNNSNYISKKLN